MSHDEKVAAAAALLGIAAVLHNKHYCTDGYSPAAPEHAVDVENCQRDGLHGYPYTECTRDSTQGWQAGHAEREKAQAHRQSASADQKAPPMAVMGCANLVAMTLAVGTQAVHIIKARSPSKHEWEIEASVDHEHMVCVMRDTGQFISARGARP